MKYTQREWDRIVGWGKVPEEYRHTVSTGKTDGENTERSDTHREEDERTLEEGKEYALNDPIWDKRWTSGQQMGYHGKTWYLRKNNKKVKKNRTLL